MDSRFTDAVVQMWGHHRPDDIARAVGCSRTTVYNIAAANGLPRRHKAPPHVFTHEEDEFLRAHWGHVPGTSVASDLGLDYEQVKGRSRRLGLYGYRTARRELVDHDFFAEPTVLAAYWAGMLAADGWILPNQKGIGLALKSGDHDHVNAFGRALGSSTEAHIYPSKDRRRSFISIYSRKLAADLGAVWNVIPNKTGRTMPPGVDLTLDEEDAFLIGHLDGDGFIGTNGKHGIRCGAIGNREIIVWLGDIVDRRLSSFGLPVGTTVREVKPGQYSFPMFEWRLNGFVADQFLAYLHHAAQDFGLPRKWDIWREFSRNWTKAVLRAENQYLAVA